jgi:hypothetical protein
MQHQLGLILSEHTDEDGALIFQEACKMGLEGIVSKLLCAPSRSGPSRDWLKIKNPDSPAMIRARGPVVNLSSRRWKNIRRLRGSECRR